MRGVRAAGAEVHEERLIRRDHLGVADELYGLVDEILGKVVSILGCIRLVERDGYSRMRSGYQLVGLAAHKTVEAFKAAPEWPAMLPCCRHLLPLRGSNAISPRRRYSTLARLALGQIGSPFSKGIRPLLPGNPFVPSVIQRHVVAGRVSPCHQARKGR